MSQFSRISSLALAALTLLALLVGCDSPVEPTSEPTPEAPATVATPVAAPPTTPPNPTLSPRAATSTTPVAPTPTIPQSPTKPSSAATSTPSPSPTERPAETLPVPCGELCNYEFWQGGEVSVEDVQAELERGADVNARDGSGETPLLTAVYLDAAPEVIRLLLDHGADPAAKNADGTPILTYPLMNGGSSEVIRWLLESGADANAKDAYGTPVLHEAVRVAAYLSHPEIVREASEAGLDLATYRIELIELLLEHGADASAGDGYGQPVLFVYFAKIIESGSEYNCRSVRFPCPDPRVVELLLEHGAEVEITSEDYTEQVMGMRCGRAPGPRSSPSCWNTEPMPRQGVTTKAVRSCTRPRCSAQNHKSSSCCWTTGRM